MLFDPSGALELRLARLEGIVCQRGAQRPLITPKDDGGSLATRIAATAAQIDLKIAAAAGKAGIQSSRTVDSLSVQCKGL